MATTAASSIEPLLRADDVIRILAISRSQMYDLIRMGILPAPIKLGKCSRWRNSDILAAISR